jgi:hypothetical protein
MRWERRTCLYSGARGSAICGDWSEPYRAWIWRTLAKVSSTAAFRSGSWG